MSHQIVYIFNLFRFIRVIHRVRCFVYLVMFSCTSQTHWYLIDWNSLLKYKRPKRPDKYFIRKIQIYMSYLYCNRFFGMLFIKFIHYLVTWQTCETKTVSFSLFGLTKYIVINKYYFRKFSFKINSSTTF